MPRFPCPRLVTSRQATRAPILVDRSRSPWSRMVARSLGRCCTSQRRQDSRPLGYAAPFSSTQREVVSMHNTSDVARSHGALELTSACAEIRPLPAATRLSLRIQDKKDLPKIAGMALDLPINQRGLRGERCVARLG